MAMLLFKEKKKTYTDVEFVDGICREDRRCQNALYAHCRRYFEDNYKGVFFAGDNEKSDIFQESFLQLWRNIENKRVYVENGSLYGKAGKPFTGQLTTYFMSIAKYKYMEWVRQSHDELLDDEFMGQFFDELSKNQTNEKENIDKERARYEILAECVSQISKRCNEILTKFYYECKSLDEILDELKTFLSKDALKTTKYKCMENLRVSANAMWQLYLDGKK